MLARLRAPVFQLLLFAYRHMTIILLISMFYTGLSYISVAIWLLVWTYERRRDVQYTLLRIAQKHPSLVK